MPFSVAVREFASRLYHTVRGRTAASRVREEMEFHVDALAARYRAQGLSEDDARRAARVAFGSSARFRDDAHDELRGRLGAELSQDFRYALRGMRHRPLLTATIVVTLALGIGANTAVFSVVNAALLRPLPYPAADRIVKVDQYLRGTPFGASAPDYVDWTAQTHSFAAMAAVNYGTSVLTGYGDPRPLNTTMVTHGFFDVMGVQPAVGRPFSIAEEAYGQGDAVIISNDLWRTSFGSRPDILRQSLRLDGISYRVVGVMSPGFAFPAGGDLWLPLAFSSTQLATQRGAHYLDVVARLKSGVTPTSATVEVERVARQLETEYPRTNTGYSQVVATPLRDALVGPSLERALVVLLGAVALVALIACANVANLLLARGANREREMAVRTALGARARDLIGMTLIESLVLSVLGGGVGVLVAMAAARTLNALRPASVQQLGQAHVDLTVLGFTFALSLVTGLLFGLAPAIQASRIIDAQGTLRSAGRAGTVSRAGWRARSTLIGAELALAVVLLSGAGLLIRSFSRLQNISAGFDPSGSLTFDLALPDARYPTPERVAGFYEHLLRQLQALPEVGSAAGISGLPLDGYSYSISVYGLDGLLEPNPGGPSTQIRVVTPGLMHTFGIPLLKGRDFTDADRVGHPNVALVNEAAAKLLWKGADPVGRTVTLGTSFGLGLGRAGGEVVGVVGDVHDNTLGTAPRPTVYVAHAQFPVSEMEIVARTKNGQSPLRLASPARAELTRLDPDLAMFYVRSMDRVTASSIAEPRFSTLLLGVFAAVALLLAIVGIHGVVAYTVSQRTREIGIRVALGATGRAVVGESLLRVAVPVGLGLGAGIVGALALTRTMSSLLYEVTPSDPLTFGIVGLGLAAIAAVAAWIPARRAARVDPMEALRAE